MDGVVRAVRAGAEGAALAVVVALVARVLMRLVAIDTFGDPSISVEGTLAICVVFVLAGAGSAVVVALLGHRAARVVGVLLTSGLLWYAGVAIGLGSFEFAQDDPMTLTRWVVFWLLFVLILGLAGLTTALGVRAGRRRAPRPAPVAVPA